MARFERLAEKTADQVNQVRLLLQASRRIGRPIHLFRGLPTLERAFFYYDAMPRVLADLIGGHSLRLEQIPDALKHLGIAQTLLETNGLGYEVLRLYATLATRFSAVCLAWCHLRDHDGDRFTLSQLQADYPQLQEKLPMTTHEGILVRLGRTAATIQARPASNAANNEEMLVFNLCMNFTDGASALHQTDAASLISGIASDLEINLVRKSKAAARKHRDDKSLRDGCLEFADLFVTEVWNGVLKQRPPTQRNRRILGSIYRMAFLQAARGNDNPPKTANGVFHGTL